MNTKIRCISLHQPWASLVAAGVKRHETRAFMPPAEAIGQPLVIHAAKRPVHPTELSPALKFICLETFGDGGWEHRLPRGAFVASCVLAHVTSTCERFEAPTTLADWHCGDWSPDRFAWRLDEVTRFAMPIPARGAQLWWYVGEEEVA